MLADSHFQNEIRDHNSICTLNVVSTSVGNDNFQPCWDSIMSKKSASAPVKFSVFTIKELAKKLLPNMGEKESYPIVFNFVNLLVCLGLATENGKRPTPGKRGKPSTLYNIPDSVTLNLTSELNLKVEKKKRVKAEKTEPEPAETAETAEPELEGMPAETAEPELEGMPEMPENEAA